MIRFFFWLNGNIFFSHPQTNLIMNNSATTTKYFDWHQTCAHDATWFQKNSKTNPRSHHRSLGEPEWWSKDQISMIWDPITKSYIYHNKNTRLTFEDPDQALFEEELPVLEIDDEPIDSRIAKYPNITALYNPNTDHYWYHNSFTGTTHFTLNQALFITQHTENAWVTTQLPTYTPYNTPATTQDNIFDWTSFTNQEVGEYEGEEEDEQYQTLDHNHHALMTEEEDVEQRAERMASEVENMLLEGLSGEQQNPYTTNSWCGTHIHFPDTDTTPQFDPVLEHQYYGREAQKRDWANLDYQDFINGAF